MHDIFEDTTSDDSAHSLELDRFKEKIRSIWSMMLKETYIKYYDIEDEDSLSEEQFVQENALKFSGDPEPVNEIDELMDMLNAMMEGDEDIESDSKAPTYKGSELNSHNEKGKIEATVYEVKHQRTPKAKEEHKAVKGGSYHAPSSSAIAARKDSQVSRKYSPLIEEIKEELRSLEDRQRTGKRRQLFR